MQSRFVIHKLPYQTPVERIHQQTETNTNSVSALRPTLNVRAAMNCFMAGFGFENLKISNTSPVTQSEDTLKENDAHMAKDSPPNQLSATAGSHMSVSLNSNISEQKLTALNNEVELGCAPVHAHISKVKTKRSNRSKIIALRKLHLFLQNIFLNRQVAVDDLDVRILELHILVEILIRKNKGACLNRLGREVSVDEIFEWAVAFKTDTSCKRVEENIKFIFKLSLKHLRMEFFKTNNLKHNVYDSEVAFYRYYFTDTAKQLDLPLTDFFDPLNYRSRQKTLNNEYISLLFTSSSFRRDFREYLSSGHLKTMYQASIPNKLLKVLIRFERLMLTNGPQKLDETIESVQKYFRTNKQCKLPWTEREVDTAVENLLQLCRG